MEASLSPTGHPIYANDAEFMWSEEKTVPGQGKAVRLKRSSYAGNSMKMNADYNGMGPTYNLDGSDDFANGIGAFSSPKVSEMVSAWSSSFEGQGASKQQEDKTMLPVIPPKGSANQRSFSSLAITSQVTKIKEKMERRSIVGPLDSELKGISQHPNFPASSSHRTKEPPHRPLTSSASTPIMSDHPLPPRSFHSSTSYPRRVRSSKCREEWVLPNKPPKPASNSQLCALGKEQVVALPQLVAEHWNQFPLSVRVVDGLLEEQLLSRRILDIHFLKKTKVIDIIDTFNQCYLIPHNSPIRFGVIYSPGVKVENFYFERVSDIINAADLPKVVTSTRKVKIRGEPSLNFGEVLIVIEIIRELHTYSKQPRKPRLKVFSFTDKKGKVLNGDVVGRFTTNPHLAQFYIPEIMDYIPKPFPLSAHLYMDADSEYPLPDILVKRPVTILNSTVEESIIAILREESIGPSASFDKCNKSVIELPVVSDIIVSVIPEDQMKLNNIVNLHTDTLTLWKDLVTQPNKRTLCDHMAVNGKTSTQHKLLTLTRKGEERKASAIEAPDLVRNDLSIAPLSLNLNTYQVLVDGVTPTSDYMPLQSYSASEEHAKSFDKTPSRNNPVKQDETLVEFHTNTHQPLKRAVAVEPRVSSTTPQNVEHKVTRNEEMECKVCHCKQKMTASERDELDKLKVDMETLRTAFRTLEEEVRQMRRGFAAVMEANQEKEQFPGPSAKANENITDLKRLDLRQVMKLLDVLQLGQYKKVFTEEAINGDLLAECNESVLLYDLGIKDLSHVSKLMRVIHGELSAQGVLNCYSDALIRTCDIDEQSRVS